MKISTVRERLLASSMICGAAIAALAATPAFAQDDNEVSEIVVTGSRIPQPNLTSVSPVQVVGSQEVLLGGRAETVDILNQLPQVTQNSSSSGGFSSTSNPLSGPGGTTTVDLRGLGQTRTLVLIDGRRLGIGDPDTGNPNSSPDISQIPSQLIDRVEVLTGGASAVYGSDAVAGVVNFVMKRHFEGVQVDGRWGVYQHTQHNETVQRILGARGVAQPDKHVWDGKSTDGSIIFGVNAPDGKGNVTGYVTYHNQEPVVQSARDYSACQVVPSGAGVPACAGSANSNQFVFANGSRFALPGAPTQVAVVGNQFVPYSTTGVTVPPPLFNSNAYADLLQGGTRYTAGFMANYEVSENFKLYSDFGFMDNKVTVNIAPTGLFQPDLFTVNCNNPFLSGQQQGALGCTPAAIASGATRDLFIGRRNIEGGGREQFYNHTNYRAVVGSRGDLFGSWKYDLYGSYYYTSLYSRNSNYLSISGIRNALQVVQGPNGPVCISGGSCVPYNIFQQGGVTDAALAALDISGISRGTTTERIIEGTVTGNLGDYGMKSPWAKDGVGVALGFNQRRDHLEYVADDAQKRGDLSGSSGANVELDRSIRVAEVYGEARIPLVQDVAFADDLSLEIGGRYSDYSTGIQAKTYKVGANYAPVTDIRFRGSYQKAIRAPSILELFNPQTITNTQELSEDPCAAGATSPAPLQQCLRTGITAAQYLTIPQCVSGQCSVLTGGNPDLGPETAKTFSLGFTTTPSFIRGFTASIDYYHIKIDGIIGTFPLNIILSRCLQTGDPDFCSQVRRGANGILFGTDRTTAGYVNGTNVNIGKRIDEGVDIQAAYSLPLSDWGIDSIGGISFSLAGSYLIKDAVTPVPGDDPYDCAGLFGPQCQTVNPKWRHTLRVNWTTPWDLTLSAAWRYYDSVKLETDTNEPSIGTGTVNAFNHTLPQRSYLDVSGLWHVNDMFSFRAGVNNVLDQDPPLVNSRIVGTGLPNTYPTYDLLGRQMFMGFTANF